MMAKLVAAKCKFFMGVFPSERYFEVALVNGEKYRGIAPRHFCWNSHGIIIEEEENTNGAEGFVAAKLLSQNADYFAVEVPDGEALAIAKELVTKRPTKISPPGSLGGEELELPGYVSN